MKSIFRWLAVAGLLAATMGLGGCEPPEDEMDVDAGPPRPKAVHVDVVEHEGDTR